MLPPPWGQWGLALWLVGVWVLFPPKVWRWQFWVLGLFAIAALLGAFLPWHHTGAWVTTLQSLSIPLPQTLSVQPALTLSVWCTLMTGLGAVIWYFSAPADPVALKRLLRLLTPLLLVLSFVALICLALGVKNPFITNSDDYFFSYFENRNQSATLYAFAGLLGLSLLLFEHRRFWRFLGALTLGVSVGALALSPSRGGWVSLAAGALVLLLRSRRGLSLTIVSLSLFAALALVGIPGLENRPQAEVPEIRLQIFSDALHLWRENPAGIGLGNFAYLYPHYQSFPMDEQIAVHPENDWLWLLCEMGLWILLLPLTLLTLRWTSNRRSPAVSAVLLALLVASLFDVPCHRLGLVVFAAALLGNVLAPPKRVRPWLLPSGVFALFWVGLLFFTSATALPLARAQRAFTASLAQGDLSRTERLHARLSALLPLDYTHYYERGVCELEWTVLGSSAPSFFRKASLLQPKLVSVPLQIGFLYAERDESEKAFGYWREALRRSGDRPELFKTILRRGGLPREAYAPLTTGLPELSELLEERGTRK